MSGRIAVALLACLTLPSWAGWRFAEPVEIATEKPGVFHHLDASGRNALAVSPTQIAIVWEDNRAGAGGCYLAIGRPPKLREFRFGQEGCYEPSVTALGGNRFALIWSDDRGVHAALADRGGIKPALSIGPAGGQGVLARHPKLGLFAAWSQTEGRWRRLYHARLAIRGDRIAAVIAAPVDAAPLQDDQIYPALAASASGLSLAWEDRRGGHTAIYASTTRDGLGWTPPRQINQASQAKSDLGRGTGAMRPTLARAGRDRIAAVWLDKRDFLAGYDVYAALSEDGGMHFGDNIKAQDSFGDAISQWHAAVAGNARGDLAIAWDDDRDGNADIWLTWHTPEGFVENISPPPAHGPAAQTGPLVALSDAGDLHLVWIERGQGDASRIRYLFGKRTP